MSESGIALYDLAPPQCPECHRFTSNRLLMSAPSGCATCDEVITRHRCTGRPARESLETGDAWECPDCGSTWTAIEVAENCGECGQEVWRKTWETVEGDRMATAPRHNPVVFTPFRNLVRDLTAPPAYSVWTKAGNAVRPESCYRASAGFTVHVQPGCRCH